MKTGARPPRVLLLAANMSEPTEAARGEVIARGSSTPHGRTAPLLIPNRPPRTQIDLIDAAKLGDASGRAVHDETKVCGERAGVECDGILVARVVLVVVICEDDHVGQGVEAEGVVVFPVDRADGLWDRAEVPLVHDRLH